MGMQSAKFKMLAVGKPLTADGKNDFPD